MQHIKPEKHMKQKHNLLIPALLACMISCGVSEEKVSQQDTTRPETPAALPKIPTDKRHLNINVLVDLSNRIDPKADPKQPGQYERDLAVVRHLALMFRADVIQKTTFATEASLRVFFHPEPNDPAIQQASDKLVAVCEKGGMDAARRNRALFRDLDSNLSLGMRTIHQKTLASGNFPGSQIWRFMKDEARLKCVKDTAKFRNLLVILTDGYLYHQANKQRAGNRYNYFERNLPHFTRFRDQGVLAREFDRDDYGIMAFDSDLSGLEVLVMEVSPMAAHPEDYDIIRAFWTKWLKELKVARYEVFKTQQPAYVGEVLNGYFAGRSSN